MKIDRDSQCPGCYHKDILTLNCDVYQRYGKGKHWFIQPASTENLIACDFCGGETLRSAEDDEWQRRT